MHPFPSSLSTMKNCTCLLLLSVLAACSNKSEVTPANFTQGMADYLQQRGNLCLAKYDWPIDISASEFEMGSRNALQMPVLQKLGLVSVADATVEQKAEDGSSSVVAVKRYELTDMGKKYYATHQFTSAAGERKVERSDVCVAKLSLDRIVALEKLDNVKDPHEVSVTYTYSVENAAPWTSEPEFDRVFPMIDRIVRGAKVAQLRQTFTRTKSGWVAADLLK